MNLLFLLLFLVGGGTLAFVSPDRFLPVLLRAGEKSAALCAGLLATYAVWMGLMQVMSDSRLSDKLASLLRPVVKKLFRAEEKETLNALALNVSANLLGLGGAATPYGIRAVARCEGQKNGAFAQNMLFVLSATSLQLFPSTAISLMAKHGAAAPTAILLPTLIASVCSTLTGVLLTFLLCGKKG